MPLKEELEARGNWLFKRRSWLPILLYPLAIAALYLNPKTTYTCLTNSLWSAFCLFISFTGLFIRAVTIGYAQKGTSGRNTSAGQIAELLNYRGTYSVVRHPLYLGNFFMWLGLFLYPGIWWFVVICCLAYWLYYERIMLAEEEFLRNKHSKLYETWASKTPAFLPDLKLWRRAELPFFFKNVLENEYNGLLAVSVTFSSLNLLAHFLKNETLFLDSFGRTVLIISSTIFLVLRTLKKSTKLLEVDRR